MKRFLHAIQTATGATQGEVIVVVTLLVAALAGNLLQRLPAGNPSTSTVILSAEELRALIDERQDVARRSPDDLEQQPRQTTDEPRVSRQAPSSTSMRPTPRQPAMVNLNTASKTRLMTLPGVGEATADRILQHRTRSPFSRPEDLMLVKGIGEKRFERIRPFVSAP